MAATGLSAALRLGTVAMVARLLAPAAFADFAVGLAILAVATTGVGGAGSSVARAISAEQSGLPDAELVDRFLPPLGLAGSLLVLASPLLAALLASVLRLATIWVPLAALVGAGALFPLEGWRGILRGRERFWELGLSQLSEVGARFLLAGACVVMWRTAESAIIGLGLGSVVALGLSGRVKAAYWVPARVSGRVHTPPDMAWFISIAIVGAVSQQIDVLLAPRALGGEGGAVYVAGASVTKALALVFIPFSTAALPRLARMDAEGWPVRKATLATLLNFALWLSGPVALGVLLPEQLIALVLGARYSSSAVVLPFAVLSLSAILLALLLAVAAAAVRHFAVVVAFTTLTSGYAVGLLLANDLYSYLWRSVVGAGAVCLGTSLAALLFRRDRRRTSSSTAPHTGQTPR